MIATKATTNSWRDGILILVQIPLVKDRVELICDRTAEELYKDLQQQQNGSHLEMLDLLTPICTLWSAA